MTWLNWFRVGGSDYSCGRCNGDLEKVVDFEGYTVFKCKSCGKRSTDRGAGLIARDKDGNRI